MRGAQLHTTLSLEIPSNIPAPLVALPSPPCDLESYKITRLHAEGGTARIYHAFESHSKRAVAIKLLRRRFHTDDVIAQLFSRHHRALESLTLPHFANVIDTGDSSWGPWSAIEWVPGRNLRALIDDGVHWSSSRLFRLLPQLCEALEALHERGVIHGDLSAHNIIFSEADETRSQERFTLIDIALPLRLNLADDADQLLRSGAESDRSARAQRRLSNETSVFGQPVYLAPECLRGQPPTISSDLYSLGVIFFELTTGTLPFNGSLTQVIHSVLHQEAPAPGIHQSPWPYPIALDALISNLLSKRPEDRCASIKQVKTLLLNMSKGHLAEVGTTTEELQSSELRQSASQLGDEHRAIKHLDTAPISRSELTRELTDTLSAETGDDFFSDLSQDTEELGESDERRGGLKGEDGGSDADAQEIESVAMRGGQLNESRTLRDRGALYTPRPQALHTVSSSARRSLAPPPSRPIWLTNLIWLLLGMLSSWIALTVWSRL